MLKIADLTRMEVHGPAAELEKQSNSPIKAPEFVPKRFSRTEYEPLILLILS